MALFPAGTKPNISVISDETNWSRSTSYPSGSTVPIDTWTSISYLNLDAGTYYLSASVNIKSTEMSNGDYPQLYHRICKQSSGGNLETLVSGYIICAGNQIPIGIIATFTTPITVYLQVNPYANGDSAVVARVYDVGCHAIKLGTT